jgi:hypothetical protein
MHEPMAETECRGWSRVVLESDYAALEAELNLMRPVYLATLRKEAVSAFDKQNELMMGVSVNDA